MTTPGAPRRVVETAVGARGAVMMPVMVIPATVRVGDIVRTGGTSRTVLDMRVLHGGGKLLIFDDGKRLTLRSSAEILAFRPHTVAPR